MKAFVAGLIAVVLLACPLVAQSDCADLDSLRALYDIREALLVASPSGWEVSRRIEEHLERLRDPLPGGGHRWVRWVRPGNDGPVLRREKLVQAAHGDPETFEARGAVPYAVHIVVPRKRSLIRANNEVWIGTVRIRSIVDGEVERIERQVGAWLKPDNSRTFDLGVIADRAEVEVETATRSQHRGAALVEVHFRQAVAEDDPANPSIEGIRALKRLQSSANPADLDLEIARLEHRLFPGVDVTPWATVVARIREAETLLRSEKDEEREKGKKILAETIRVLPR